MLLWQSPAEALEVWDEGSDFTGRRGMAGSSTWLAAESMWALFDLGRWDELLHRADRVLEFAERGGPNYMALVAVPQKALVLSQRGAASDAATLVDEFLPRVREAADLQVLVPALAAAAELAAGRGDLNEAAELAGEIETATRSGAIYRARHLPQLVSIALAAGKPELAAAFLDTDYPSTGRVGHAVVAARAVAEEEAGDTDAALALHEDAAARWAEHGFVLGQAESLLGVGRCLVTLGRPHEAAAPLQAAREIFQGLGAEPSVRRADDLLARATSMTA